MLGSGAASGGKLVNKKTKAPTRFSEASLVRELENKGIGRPATFAAIVGLRRGNTVVQNVGTVAKTMPEFTSMWEGMLAQWAGEAPEAPQNAQTTEEVR